MLSDFATWLKDVLLWVPRKLWAELLEALAAVIQAIPVPDFFQTAKSAFTSIPPSVLFFAAKFAVPEGLTMILAAYALRFVLRRIPLIG